MPSAVKNREASLLTSQLKTKLWARVMECLNNGAVLVANVDFLEVMVETYFDLTGEDAALAVKRQIARMVAEVNWKHPEMYLAQGVQNAVNRAFDKGVRQLNWNLTKIQEEGFNTLKHFSELHEIADLLAEANIRPDQIDILGCLKNAVESIQASDSESPAPDLQSSALRPAMDAIIQEGAGAGEPKSEEQSSALRQAMDAIIQDGVGAGEPESGKRAEEEATVQEAIESGEVDQEEARQRTQQVDKRGAELVAREMVKVPQNLAAYVDEGRISEEEAEKVKALSDVDKRLEKGEIDEAEASNIRNSILSGRARDALEKKIKEAVDYAVCYLQVFESMKKISAQYDGILRFIIRHKEAVLSQREGTPALAEVIKALMDDVPTLERLIDVMERKDQEVRMLTVRLPPYNFLMGRRLEHISNATIEEEFVDALRDVLSEELADRLNSPDASVRVRPAADILCFIALVDHVIKRTPFRKELRMLRIAQSIEQLYRSTSDMNEARHQAENFLNRRLRKIFPDLSADESNEIKQRSTEMIDAIEQKILEERRAEVETKRQKTEETAPAKRQQSGGGDGGEDDLTDEEKQRGVLIGRVEMRVAGNTRRVPYKIMPDIEEPERFVIAQRDPDTEELVPQMRRGVKRFVEKDSRDGSWKLL